LSIVKGRKEITPECTLPQLENSEIFLPASRQTELDPQRMAIDLVQLRALAQQREDKNWRFRRFLKTRCRLEPEEVDRRVFAATERVWSGIDCAQCANCCREIKPTFSEENVSRLAQRLAMAPQAFGSVFV
jgi:hypothetical protein